MILQDQLSKNEPFFVVLWAARAIRRQGESGNGGIDGAIKEDKLGLSIIYIKAKRWDGSMTGPKWRSWKARCRASEQRKAFSSELRHSQGPPADYTGFMDTKTMLIDNARLGNFMIDQGIGVATQAIYEIKRIDSDYFADGWTWANKPPPGRQASAPARF
jgi:restriction system protein